MKTDEINRLDSESGIIATLIKHPDFSFYSENLLPNHFTNRQNRCFYTAICEMAKNNITTVDAFGVMQILESSDAMRRIAKDITIEQIQELIEMSEILARNSIEEYKLLVGNVVDAAFRRDTYQRLKECEDLCCNEEANDIQEKIYGLIDEVMTDYSTTDDIPQFKDVIDDCWNEIQNRQQDGYAGIPFKFDKLNEYATIERGELFIFAAEAKQGKSMMLLNCAMDLLKKDQAVLYLDSELNTRMFTARVLAHLTGIEYRRLTTGNYTEEEKRKIDDARAWLKTRKFTHIYIPMFDQQSIYTAVKKVKHVQGLDVLIVDYFKGSGEGTAFDSYQELGKFVDKHHCSR